MSKEQAKYLIMSRLTVELLQEFKPENVDLWDWLDDAAVVAMVLRAAKRAKRG